ncbi:MAG TPA: chorismate synthase [bacterium]|nr:chorismate synthase [bacterium]
MIRWLTSGESHGSGLVGIIDGVPAHLKLSVDVINHQLWRRQQGYGRGGRMKIETDQAEIISGVRFGETIGAPIGLRIRNNDWENWTDKMMTETPSPEILKTVKPVTLPRPGHADLAGIQKFGFDDIRPVIERSSARETAMRVALGTVAREVLLSCGIRIASHVTHIGRASLTAAESEKLRVDTMTTEAINQKADLSSVRVLDAEAEQRMIAVIKETQKQGDSLGGIFEVYADGLPAGIGSYTHWDKKLDGVIAQHMASIPAIKGVEIGNAFDNALQWGSEVHDAIFYDDVRGYYRKTNRSGGLEGGMTTGERIIVRCAMKPIPTLARPLMSVDIRTHEAASAHKERTDTVSVPACSVVAESMLALALINPLLEKYGGDSMNDIRTAMGR